MHRVFQFCKKKSIQLSFSSHRTSKCRSPPRIGGRHFLLCQHTSTKDIAGQSANDGDDDDDAGGGHGDADDDDVPPHPADPQDNCSLPCIQGSPVFSFEIIIVILAVI